MVSADIPVRTRTHHVQDCADGEEHCDHHQHRQPADAAEEEGVYRPSGARQYRVHKQDQEEPGETSGARQYR